MFETAVLVNAEIQNTHFFGLDIFLSSLCFFFFPLSPPVSHIFSSSFCFSSSYIFTLKQCLWFQQLVFDLQISGLDSISSWLPLVEEWLPEVMILVCDRVSENGVSRQKAQEWCIRHGFELVELNPEELPDEDDDFPESTGVKRIIQALNANVWSNVEMKSDLNQGFGFLPALAGANRRLRSEGNESPEPHPLPAESVDSAVDRGEDAAETEGEQRGLVAADPVLDMDIQELANLTAGEGDLENFERLFSKLKEMKEKAATLPHEQRKLHAEKVAKAFWMAIGGDRDEIEGLSSDEDN
uniref:Alpha and gamma adaptin binding protein n=1 Tax=Anolis carolinensis TaxID=28377 RepID=A0A803TY34_ANOCA